MAPKKKGVWKRDIEAATAALATNDKAGKDHLDATKQFDEAATHGATQDVFEEPIVETPSPNSRAPAATLDDSAKDVAVAGDVLRDDVAKEQDNGPATADTVETPAKLAKRKRGAVVTAVVDGEAAPEKKPRKSKSTGSVADGEAPPEKKARKPKPTGPYTKYKEAGEPIPEPELARVALVGSTGEEDGPVKFRHVKVVVWNLGGIRAFLRNRSLELTNLAEVERPDLLGIFEHKLQADGKDTEEALSALREALPDYDVATVNYSTAKKGYSGTMVLTRKGLSLGSLSSVSEDLPSAANEGRLVTVEFDAVSIVFAYVPNAGEGLKRLDERIAKWDCELRSKLCTLADEKATVLIGDLNVAHLDLDIWNVEAPHIPKSAGTTLEERESFGKLLEAGFVDGFRHFHPDALGAFTYWSVRAGNRKANKGLRLDYVVVSKGMVAREKDEMPALIDTFHLPEFQQAGDHCPIGAVLRIAVHVAPTAATKD